MTRSTSDLILLTIFFVIGLSFTIYLGVSRARANWKQLRQMKAKGDRTDVSKSKAKP